MSDNKSIEYPVKYAGLKDHVADDRVRFYFNGGDWIEVHHTGTCLYINGRHRLIIEPNVANAITVKLERG